MKARYENLDTSNLATGLENAYEDLTVNTQAADFAAQQQQQALANLQGMGTYATGLEQQGIAALGTLGAENQQLEQMKLNQLAQAQQQAYQLPMTRIQDVANIYGGIAGSIPGSPTMPFQPSPIVTGIGGGLGAANICLLYTSPSPRDQRGSRIPS